MSFFIYTKINLYTNLKKVYMKNYYKIPMYKLILVEKL